MVRSPPNRLTRTARVAVSNTHEDSSLGVTVYRAKQIITMNPANPEGAHVAVRKAVRNGMILGVGSEEEVGCWGDYELDTTFADRDRPRFRRSARTRDRRWHDDAALRGMLRAAARRRFHHPRHQRLRSTDRRCVPRKTGWPRIGNITGMFGIAVWSVVNGTVG